jgi:hypothetical protein
MTDDGQEPVGRIRVTGPGTLVVLGSAGLLIGWAARGVAIRNDWATPTPSPVTVGAIWFAAAVTGAIAFLTHRTVQRERRLLTAQQGMGRLVLGKTVARLAAFVLGGGVGMAISVIGVAGENADRVMLRAGLGALGALAGLVAALLLEHACRVPPDDSADLT